jgi:cellulose synthase/poly-beta-1,6-N-acetylglucosamine synthase-like glycosyltransferase
MHFKRPPCTAYISFLSLVSFDLSRVILCEASFVTFLKWASFTDVRLQMGLLYGCPVEDVITGLSIQCRGWKSVYFNPSRKAFLGVVPVTLPEVLVQHKRWSEGDLQILLSKYSPAWFAHGKISLGLRLGYCVYCLWAPNSLAVLYYSVIPSLYLLKGISLFPQVRFLASYGHVDALHIYC